MGSTRSIFGSALAAFAAVLAVCAVSAGSAFAEEKPEWQQGKAKLSEAVKTKSKGNVKFYDVTVPAEVECESSTEGTVGPGAAGKITSWTLSSCKPTAKAINRKGEEKPNECEKVFSAEIKALPWTSELGINGKSIFDSILFGEGTPSFAVTCEVIKMKVTDTCRSSELFRITAGITNVTGGVNQAIDDTIMECTVGGESGIFETTQFLEATKGSALEANIV